MKKFLLLTSTMFFALFVFGQKLPFQGKLIESGTPVNGTRSIEVGLSALSWSETHASVQITDGLYFIVIGSITPLPANLFTGVDERQLTLSVDGTALSAVTLYKPLGSQPDSLLLKGPGNGSLKGGFRKGSAVNENLPVLALNGNLTDAFDRVYADVSSNADNTTEYGNVGVNSTNGYNSHMAPGYLGLNYNNAPAIQFFSQNWSNKGHSGTLLLKGPNSTNFEIGSKHWENADLPWMNMRGTSTDQNDPGLINLGGHKFNENSVDKEMGQLTIHDSDKKKAFINSREIMLLKPDWSPFVSLSSNGDAGSLELKGQNSTYFYLGKGGDPDQGIMQMFGKTNQERLKLFVKTDWDTQEKGTIELHGEDGNKVGIIPTQFALHKSDWSFYGRLFTDGSAGKLELFGNTTTVSLKKDNNTQGARLETFENQNGFSGRLLLFGPNNENIFMGTKDWESSGLPIIALRGSDAIDKVTIHCIAGDQWGEERGIILIRNTTGNSMSYGDNGVFGNNGPFNMWSGARVNGTLELNGNFTGSGTQTYTSDQRLKKDIQPLGENILGKIESLNGVSYYWRKDEFPQKNFSDDQQIGLIAQQLEAQFPALVKTNDDGFKAVNYNGFTAVLLQAVKELNAKVEKLESENQKLQAELSASASNRTEIDQLKSQMEILTKLVMEKSTTPSGLSSAETVSSAGLK